MSEWNEAIEAAAAIFDARAADAEKAWLEYRAAGGSGPATSFHNAFKADAESIRKLKRPTPAERSGE